MPQKNSSLKKGYFEKDTARYLLKLYRLVCELVTLQEDSKNPEFYNREDLHDGVWLDRMVNWALPNYDGFPSRDQLRIRYLQYCGKFAYLLEEFCIIDTLVAVSIAERRWDAIGFQNTIHHEAINEQIGSEINRASQYLRRDHEIIQNMEKVRDERRVAYDEIRNLKYHTCNALYNLAKEIMQSIFSVIPEDWREPFLSIDMPNKFARCADLRQRLQPCRTISDSSYLQRLSDIDAQAQADYHELCHRIVTADQQFASLAKDAN